MTEQYIKVYERILRHPELSRLEALIVCEIMRWPNGCYKSSAQIAKLLKSDTRTIQRSIKSLFERKWLTILWENKRSRYIWATPKELPEGELMQYAEKAGKAMITLTANKLSTKI